jgi:hypothetical protein
VIPLILEAAASALKIGSAIAGHSAQAKAAKANKAAANLAFQNDVLQINTRENQEQDAATQTILSADRQARSVDARARVAAGAAGVAGASVDALLADIERDKLSFGATTNRNLGLTIQQLEEQKVGAAATRDNRIASTPAPNPLLTGLQIASAGLDFGTFAYDKTRPKPGAK